MEEQGRTNPASPQPPGFSLKEVERLYTELSVLLPHERERALASRCGGNPALEQEVRSLLRAEENAGGFLESPALGGGVAQFAGIAADADDLIGRHLGSYRVLERLASGGMGTVYLAERSDGQYEQRVAIKVIKRGMDTEEVLHRFREERQTLAAVDHPNIARMLDAGTTPEDRPYLVMEYVPGASLDAYCNQHRLTVKQRLRLFISVCEAVHAAHRALIIHRDIKPGNILVTDTGVPKLVDFGIAKVISGTARTGARPATIDTDRRLTFEYASPEQVAGEALTTSSDVYSLGIVLYELLTGARPYAFETRSADEVRRKVCLEVPRVPSQSFTRHTLRMSRTTDPAGVVAPIPPVLPPASSAVPAPPGTPDGSPSREEVARTRGVSPTRLRSILAGDLDNIIMMALRKEPSRRYASAEQFASDLQRYLDGMPVRARRDTPTYRAVKFIRRHMIGTSATVAAIVLLAAGVVVLSRQNTRIRQQHQEVLAANTRAEQNRDFLEGVVSGADVAEKGPDTRLLDVLHSAADQIQAQPPADPLTRASAQQAIGNSLLSLGDVERASPLLHAAAVTYESALPAGSAARLGISQDLARLAVLSGELDRGEGLLRELLTQVRAVQPVDRAREADLLNDLGACLRRQMRGDEAVAIQREALAARRALEGAESLKIAESHNNLGSALMVAGDVPGAVASLREALRIREALLPAGHPLILRAQRNLGLALQRDGKIAEAIPLLTRAAEAWPRAFGPTHPAVVAAYTSLAQALVADAKPGEARAWLDRALKWQVAHAPGNARQIAATRANIGIALSREGQHAKAVEVLEASLDVLADDPSVAGIRRKAQAELATLYERAGRAEDARRLREAGVPAGK